MRRIILVITFFLVILSLLTSNIVDTTVGDVAEYLNNPTRILHGQLPYRDFWLLFPPGEVYFPAAIYKIFGASINNVLVANVLVRLLSAVLAFIIVKRIVRINLYAFIPAVLVYFTAINNIYIALILAAAYFLINFFRHSQRRDLVISGLFLGFTFWFRFYEAAAVLTAFTATIIFHRRDYRSLAIYLTAATIPVIILGLLFRPVLPLMVDQVVFTSLNHGTVWHLPYFIELKLNLSFLFQSFSLVSLLDTPWLIGLYFLPLTTLPIALYLLLTDRQLNKLGKTLLFLFLIWALLLFPRALRRGAVSDVAHCLLPVSLLSGYLISLPIPRRAKQIFYLFLALSLWLVVATSVKNIRFINQPRYIIRAPYGTLQTNLIEQKVYYQQLVDGLATDPSNLFYTGWDQPPLYALTGINNPTYYDSLIDLLAVPSSLKEELVCRQLQAAGQVTVIHQHDGGVTDVDRRFYGYAQLTPKLNRCLDLTDSK